MLLSLKIPSISKLQFLRAMPKTDVKPVLGHAVQFANLKSKFLTA